MRKQAEYMGRKLLSSRAVRLVPTSVCIVAMHHVKLGGLSGLLSIGWGSSTEGKRMPAGI